jgi:uncharacterized membrane protein (UPF0127 family)
MKVLVIIPALLFTSLLLVAGCGGGGGESSTGSEPAVTTPSGTVPATEAETSTGKTNPETTAAQAGAPDSTLTIINSAGQRVPVRVEIASTEAQRERGLMDRTALAEDAGMLFVFEQEQSLSFWMRDTLIPLSIAFIDSQENIIDIQDMQPLDETPHPSAAPAQYALEVNQGFFADRGIEVGDVLERQS